MAEMGEVAEMSKCWKWKKSRMWVGIAKMGKVAINGIQGKKGDSQNGGKGNNGVSG